MKRLKPKQSYKKKKKGHLCTSRKLYAMKEDNGKHKAEARNGIEGVKFRACTIQQEAWEPN